MPPKTRRPCTHAHGLADGEAKRTGVKPVSLTRQKGENRSSGCDGAG
jgi:hypothetical protein